MICFQEQDHFYTETTCIFEHVLRYNAHATLDLLLHCVYILAISFSLHKGHQALQDYPHLEELQFSHLFTAILSQLKLDGNCLLKLSAILVKTTFNSSLYKGKVTVFVAAVGLFFM